MRESEKLDSESDRSTFALKIYLNFYIKKSQYQYFCDH